MKLRETFVFEFGYQLRRGSTWAYFVALLGLTYQLTTQAYIPNARTDGYLFNGPFVIAAMTILGALMALPVIASFAGDAGARDVHSRMHPLVYTTPVGAAAYLGGRFLAAFALSALVLLAVPAALLLSLWAPGLESELLGPLRAGAYLGAYAFLALPNAFVATALLFALSVLSGRAMASYLGAVSLFLAAVLSWMLVAETWGRWKLASWIDPVGLTLMADVSRGTTLLEKSTMLIALEGSLLANRLLWLSIAVGVIALTYLRFRFVHPAAGRWAARGERRRVRLATVAEAEADGATGTGAAVIHVPTVHRTFGIRTRVAQTLAVTGESFRNVVLSWGGLSLLAFLAVLVMTGSEMAKHLGLRLIPTTARISSFMGDTGEILWMIVPLLIVFFAGELVWRERDGGLGDIADAAPVPGWVPLVGKLAGLCLALFVWQALVMVAAMLIQALLGYYHFEVGLYGRILFGIQLTDYLLLAVLAVVVHALVDHKYVGHLVALGAYGLTTFSEAFGVGHNLLVYGSDPGWAYSDMRGFGPFLVPWLAFKLYWAAWALLLAVLARLLWMRGRERGLRARVHLARRRLSASVAGLGALAVGLVLMTGGFIFYNTNILNTYRSPEAGAEWRAEYERRYGQYRNALQPQLSGTNLTVEIHPTRQAVEIRGQYLLVNRGEEPVETIHIATATASAVETRTMDLDRPATRVLADQAFGHWIYTLDRALMPGDSLSIDFEVHRAPRGFPNRGIDASVAANGTFFTNQWLPAIGYQPGRELAGAGDRRAHGLADRSMPSLHDADAGLAARGSERTTFDAIVGTDEGQTAVAPGRLVRTWKENGRSYFHYVTDVPIRNDYAFFSAAYAVHRAHWNGVLIEIVHHPGHAWNTERMMRGVQASLDHFTEQFGPYPHGQIRLVEHPGGGTTLHAFPVNVSYTEGFSLFDPDRDRRDVDFPFAVVAHEVAHHWWGNQLYPARVEGAALLSESLAWYSALAVVEQTHGAAHLGRLLDVFRRSYLTPRARADVPLLQASDPFSAYRKGPFAMHALREYVGEERVNRALRRLLEAHREATPPLPTSLDLYRELRAVTPDSLRYLLADLFEANTFWDLAVEQVSAEQALAGEWRVTLDVRARKVVVDTLGVETESPMNDLVEIGVYPRSGSAEPDAPLYLRLHRVQSGLQRITVSVPGKPGRAGIDPRRLLMDPEPDDNVMRIAGAGGPGTAGGASVRIGARPQVHELHPPVLRTGLGGRAFHGRPGLAEPHGFEPAAIDVRG